MKIFIIFLTTLFCHFQSFCQVIEQYSVNSGGALQSQNGITMSTSLGQNSINTFQSTNIIITQGFQQVLNMYLVGSKEEKIISDKIKLYPNPTHDGITVEIDESISNNWDFEIFGTNGNRLQNGKIGSGVMKISVAHLPVGQYNFLLKSNNGLKVYSSKFIKVE